MTKKELQEQLTMLDREAHEIEKELISLQKYRKLSEQRYQMLLYYFNLKEEEYAELEEVEFTTYKGIDRLLNDKIETKAVKKVKLVKNK